MDPNDIEHVHRLGFKPVAAIPCSLRKGHFNPCVSQFYLGDDRCLSLFHIKPIYYERVDGEFRPISEVATYHGNKKITLNSSWQKIHPKFLMWLLRRQDLIGGEVSIPITASRFLPIHEGVEIHFTTTTVYPDPNPETTSVDGYAGETAGDFASARAGAGDDADDTASPIYTHCQDDSGGSGTVNIYRGIILFDTSSIPDTDTIDSATIDLFMKTEPDGDNDGNDYINIYTSAPASNTAVVAGDFDSLGTTAQATAIDIGSLVDEAYNTFTLNATGLTNISKTGVSKFGTREGHDAVNDPVAANTTTGCSYSSAEVAGTANDPKLAVVHSAAATGVEMLSLLGVG